MRTWIKNSLILHALIAGLGLLLASRVMAQTFTTLHSFTELINFTNSDGANPSGSLILSAYTLYGTATYGGSSGNGTVFAVSTDGTGFTNLHDFNYIDGAYSDAGLITNLSGNTIYGTASSGGSSGGGTVFAINPDGTGFTNLYGFTGGSDGANPFAGLTLAGTTLYGTAAYGRTGYNGSAYTGNGTVFAVNTDGTGFTNLYSFTSFNINSSGFFTNSDGA